ncbi:hypothetical protein BCR37DRAFT_388624 [Protomyces lactucae-debilis]|uniref:Uncharacterized protein n=1 Tax=Protomyces lactucae-debilis TaxID=2754530 RepID=A0A1Y2F7X3_PROLT|nr:uncharacterized protein BCR37DRAFT_388624 [Protomyces lactucae-debilis]ORY79015.1 hypothetical protein BCR37DRAFT_388624 [Protomyces lactucae-debilis]
MPALQLSSAHSIANTSSCFIVQRLSDPMQTGTRCASYRHQARCLPILLLLWTLSFGVETQAARCVQAKFTAFATMPLPFQSSCSQSSSSSHSFQTDEPVMDPRFWEKYKGQCFASWDPNVRQPNTGAEDICRNVCADVIGDLIYGTAKSGPDYCQKVVGIDLNAPPGAHNTRSEPHMWDIKFNNPFWHYESPLACSCGVDVVIQSIMEHNDGFLTLMTPNFVPFPPAWNPEEDPNYYRQVPYSTAIMGPPTRVPTYLGSPDCHAHTVIDRRLSSPSVFRSQPWYLFIANARAEQYGRISLQLVFIVQRITFMVNHQYTALQAVSCDVSFQDVSSTAGSSSQAQGVFACTVSYAKHGTEGSVANQIGLRCTRARGKNSFTKEIDDRVSALYKSDPDIVRKKYERGQEAIRTLTEICVIMEWNNPELVPLTEKLREVLDDPQWNRDHFEAHYQNLA